MTLKVGDYVSALALRPDGGLRVRGVVVEIRHRLVLLDGPHGRWCHLEAARKLVHRAGHHRAA